MDNWLRNEYITSNWVWFRSLQKIHRGAHSRRANRRGRTKVIISQSKSLKKWPSLMTWSFIALPTPFSVPTEKPKVDWERIKRCLAEIDKNSREFLHRALLIGGAACWFYRIQLKRANDADFKVDLSSPENESQWLSRDIDF